MPVGKYDFLSQKAPDNYVAGLGRGATGFTTRSDLGPAREGPSEDQIKEVLAKRAAQHGLEDTVFAGKGRKPAEEENEAPEDNRFQDPDDEVGLFAHGSFDKEDDEADRIYQDVDEKMERRRKLRRYVFNLSFGLALPLLSFPFLSSPSSRLPPNFC